MSTSTVVDEHLLDSTIRNCGEELEFAINSLQQLNLLDSSDRYSNIVPAAEQTVQNTPSSSQSSNSTGNPLSSEWADLFLKEMTNAARARAFRALEDFEKEKTATLTLKNMILKRAVVILHERLREKQRETEDLKKTLSEYHEKVRILELKNYSLAMHMRQVENDAASGGFHRTDVF